MGFGPSVSAFARPDLGHNGQTRDVIAYIGIYQLTYTRCRIVIEITYSVSNLL